MILSAYVGKGISFEDDIGAFALAYARQTELDRACLADAMKGGRLPASAQDPQAFRPLQGVCRVPIIRTSVY